MENTLAIFLPTIGIQSETFITRHLTGLLPGRCVVVAGSRLDKSVEIDAPVLVLDKLPNERLGQMMVRLTLQKLRSQPGSFEKEAVCRFLKKHGVTVAMGEYLFAFLPWVPVCRGMGIKTFVHAHGFDVSGSLRNDYWRREYIKYRDADGIITVNQVQHDRLVALGLDASRIHGIPYGVTVPDFIKRPFVTGREIRCLVVGRMVSKKAPILCLDAFRRAAERIPGLHLDYVGEGKLLSSAQQFVKIFNMGSIVTLHGGKDHAFVNDLLALADIFIMHSVTDENTGDEEGLPVSILEAMANGIPVVATRHAGIPEAVVDGITGLLSAEGDSSGMAENIVRLAADGALRLRMGEAGHERAKEKFSWAVQRSHLLDVMGLSDKGGWGP